MMIDTLQTAFEYGSGPPSSVMLPATIAYARRDVDLLLRHHPYLWQLDYRCFAPGAAVELNYPNRLRRCLAKVASGAALGFTGVTGSPSARVGATVANASVVSCETPTLRRQECARPSHPTYQWQALACPTFSCTEGQEANQTEPHTDATPGQRRPNSKDVTQSCCYSWGRICVPAELRVRAHRLLHVGFEATLSTLLVHRKMALSFNNRTAPNNCIGKLQSRSSE